MIVAVGAWRGMGASVTALALAAAAAVDEPEGAWLVEADPAGGVLAGRVHLGQFAVGGLEQVAFPSERVAAIATLHEVSQRVGDVSVVAAPADPFRAFACHQLRVPWASSLRELPGTVVVDVGRLRVGSPAWPLLHIADELLLVCSPEVTAVVASHDWVRNGGRVGPGGRRRRRGRGVGPCGGWCRWWRRRRRQQQRRRRGGPLWWGRRPRRGRRWRQECAGRAQARPAVTGRAQRRLAVAIVSRTFFYVSFWAVPATGGSGARASRRRLSNSAMHPRSDG